MQTMICVFIFGIAIPTAPLFEFLLKSQTTYPAPLIGCDYSSNAFVSLKPGNRPLKTGSGLQ